MDKSGQIQISLETACSSYHQSLLLTVFLLLWTDREGSHCHLLCKSTLRGKDELLAWEGISEVSRGSGERGMNLLCSDNVFHSGGLGTEQPLEGCGRWQKPRPAVEPWNPPFLFQKRLLDKAPACIPHLPEALGILLTAHTSQPGLVPWAQLQPSHCLPNVPTPSPAPSPVLWLAVSLSLPRPSLWTNQNGLELTLSCSHFPFPPSLSLTLSPHALTHLHICLYLYFLIRVANHFLSQQLGGS